MELPFQLENDLEKKITNDPEWIVGAEWGEGIEERKESHPEGKVKFHIKEVLDNVDKLEIDKETREKLRLIAIVHDTFKYKVDVTKQITGENHHPIVAMQQWASCRPKRQACAMLARRFTEKYVSDKEILDIIELHDEAFASWQKGNRDSKWDSAEARALKLLDRLGNCIKLYLMFYKCDNETGGKKQDCYQWFEKIVIDKKLI
ncbi:MAG: hypothetical protein Q7S22_01755 [Candidatus Micrarchaeota archaeon]|nr:hypothetical protein [Candidatus Micrarchaeota archaeon]